MQRGTGAIIEEIGVRTPDLKTVKSLAAGEMGYLIAGIKDVGEARSEKQLLPQE